MKLVNSECVEVAAEYHWIVAVQGHTRHGRCLRMWPLCRETLTKDVSDAPASDVLVYKQRERYRETERQRA